MSSTLKSIFSKAYFFDLECYGTNPTIAYGGFGIVSKVIHKKSDKIYTIKRIALNKEELEKAFKDLKLMKGLKSGFVIEHIDSWIEENALKFEDFNNTSASDISSSHPIFDPKNTVLLHIQMEFCCETLNEVIKQLSNELIENNSEMMKTLCYYISSELLNEIIECVHYLHERNTIHRDLKPANILITDGVNGRFVKLANPYFNPQSVTQCSASINFIAPEVMTSQKYDMKADIYSIGRIIEELFFFIDNL
jgi:serine/threonine protein kinase